MVIALLTSSPGFPNAGVPMIIVVMPSIALSFLPVVLVEARFLGKRLFLEGRRAVRTSILANLVSGAVGVPVTWLVLAALQMITGGADGRGIASAWQKLLAVTWQAPWLIRYESELPWMVPAAALALLFPFFLVSWRVESAVARIALQEVPRRDISRAVLVANAVTYAGLALVAAGVLAVRLA